MGIDFFYYRDSVFHDSILPLFKELPKLRELILFPVLDMSKLLKEISKVYVENLESLQLGIVNTNPKELISLFKEGIAQFPKLQKLKLKI